MQEMTLGEIIEELRIRKKITKQKLCEGLCSITALSRYESDLRLPDVFLLEGILERLGGDQIDFTLISCDNDIKLKKIREKIFLYWANFDLLNIKNEILIYKKLSNSSNNLHKQFIYWQIGKIREHEENYYKSLKSYSKALACTKCENYRKKLEKGVLTNIELKLVIGIGRVKYKTDNKKAANTIFDNIKNYCSKHNFYKDHADKGDIYIEILFYLAEINYCFNKFDLSLKYLNRIIQKQTSEYKLFCLRESFLLKKEIESKVGTNIQVDDNSLIVLELLECDTPKKLADLLEERKWNYIVNRI